MRRSRWTTLVATFSVAALCALAVAGDAGATLTPVSLTVNSAGVHYLSLFAKVSGGSGDWELDRQVNTGSGYIPVQTFSTNTVGQTNVVIGKLDPATPYRFRLRTYPAEDFSTHDAFYGPFFTNPATGPTASITAVQPGSTGVLAYVLIGTAGSDTQAYLSLGPTSALGSDGATAVRYQQASSDGPFGVTLRAPGHAVEGKCYYVQVTATNATGTTTTPVFMFKSAGASKTVDVSPALTCPKAPAKPTQKPYRIVGSARGETLRGHATDDTMLGGGGDDTLYGSGGGDILRGGTGSDVLAGGAGADEIDGNGGNDTLIGGLGPDILDGGVGNDTIRAKDGVVDVIDCSKGHDTVYADKSDYFASKCPNATMK